MENNCPVCKTGTLNVLTTGGNKKGFFAITSYTINENGITAQAPMPVETRLCNNCGYLALFTKSEKTEK